MLCAVGFVAENELLTGTAGAVDKHWSLEVGGEVIAIALVVQGENGKNLGVARAHARFGQRFCNVGLLEIYAQLGGIGNQEGDAWLVNALQQQQRATFNRWQFGQTELRAFAEAEKALWKIEQAIFAQLYFAEAGIKCKRGAVFVADVGVHRLTHH
jgi:hypothetical protein